MRDGLLGAIRTEPKGKLWKTSAAQLQAYIERQGTPLFALARFAPP